MSFLTHWVVWISRKKDPIIGKKTRSDKNIFLSNYDSFNEFRLKTPHNHKQMDHNFNDYKWIFK